MSADPVLELELLDVKPFQASVRVRSIYAVSVAYGVGGTEEEALGCRSPSGPLRRSSRPWSLI